MTSRFLLSEAGVELSFNYNPDEELLLVTVSKGNVNITKRIEGHSIVHFYESITRLLSMHAGSNKVNEEEIPTSIVAIRAKAFARSRSQSQGLDADVFIGLPQKEIDLFTIEHIQNATGDFMEAMGFEMETKDEPVFGSFFQDLKYFFKGRGKAEAIDVYQKGKTALELQYLNLPSAEATAKLAGAASGLIGALSGVDEAVLRLGGILLVKVTNDGIPRIVAETVSPELAQLLDKNPKLLENPHAVFGMIAAMQATSKRIAESGAAEAVEVE